MPRYPSRALPGVEPLEDRRVPATLSLPTAGLPYSEGREDYSPGLRSVGSGSMEEEAYLYAWGRMADARKEPKPEHEHNADPSVSHLLAIDPLAARPNQHAIPEAVDSLLIGYHGFH